MSRLVCYIDADGQVATCVADNGVWNCEGCPHNDDAHKKWIAELHSQPKTIMAASSGKYPFKETGEDEDHLLNSIKTKEIDVTLNFIVDDIIIHASASTEGIGVGCVTRCFEPDLGCDLADCIYCPYTDKFKQEAIFNKYEEPLVEIMRDLYKKIEALRK